MSDAPMQYELTILDVDHNGTITDLTVPEPCTRADVFGSVSLRFTHSCEDLIGEIEQCEPLVWHFRQLGQEHALELSQRLLQGGRGSAYMAGPQLSPTERLILRALRDDENENGSEGDGWQKWIEFSGDTHLEHFKSLVEDWLASDIDWTEQEYFDAGYSGQDVAKRLLEDLPMRILKALGVVIVDGEYPGSTYSAAQLGKSVGAANEVAELLELGIRFAQQANCEDEAACPAQEAWP